MFKRRSEIEIIGEILDLFMEGAEKTEILHQSNVSLSQLQHYLSFLLDKNVIEENIIAYGNVKSSKIYVTTEKGINLLEKINNLYTYFE